LAKAADPSEVKTSKRPASEKGFVPLKGSWQAKRSVGWLNLLRRLSGEVEKTMLFAKPFIQLAFISARLANMG